MYHKYTQQTVKCSLFLVFFLQLALSAFPKTNTARSTSSNATVSATLVSIFTRLSEQSKYRFSYGEAIIADKQMYTVSMTQPVPAVLKELSAKAGFTYNVIDNLVLITKRPGPNLAEAVQPVRQVVKAGLSTKAGYRSRGLL